MANDTMTADVPEASDTEGMARASHEAAVAAHETERAQEPTIDDLLSEYRTPEADAAAEQESEAPEDSPESEGPTEQEPGEGAVESGDQASDLQTIKEWAHGVEAERQLAAAQADARALVSVFRTGLGDYAAEMTDKDIAGVLMVELTTNPLAEQAWNERNSNPAAPGVLEDLTTGLAKEKAREIRQRIAETPDPDITASAVAFDAAVRESGGSFAATDGYPSQGEIANMTDSERTALGKKLGVQLG